jgi:hypothetical protein
MIQHPDILRRFTLETTEHVMTVAHDDGLYRHLKFRHTGKNYSGYYWFDLITVPGSLIFRGDGESFVFARLPDMFEFFRESAYNGQPNPTYWDEKVTSDQDSLKKFSYDKFVARVKEEFIETARNGGVPPGTGKALLELAEDYDLHYEVNARQFLDDFEHDGFSFYDVCEWDFRDYDWWFLWACQAIVWGIAYYDTGVRPPLPDLPAEQARAAKASRPPRIVDVHLPEPVTEALTS